MTRMLSRPVSNRPPARAACPESGWLQDVQHLVMEGVSWDFYERLLKEISPRAIRVTYDRGSIEMMSPLPEHEKPSGLIARLVQTITFVRGMPVCSWGSTTFRRKELAKGLEPDKCFFVANERKVRGLKRWNPKKDPPPDLAVEADITRRSIAREPIYAALGVPELWRWDGNNLHCLVLEEGAYRAVRHSFSFPFLKPADLERFIRMHGRHEENEVIRKFTKWLNTLDQKA